MKEDKINKLNELQAKENNGRGISCIRTIINCLKNDEYEDALACCFNENDKIRNYPKVQKYLEGIFSEYKEERERIEKLFK